LLPRLLLLLALLACDRLKQSASEPSVKAQFGVFYGGQIQQRRQIPFELDPAQQTHGFRVQFAQPPAQPHEVSWQLSPPRAASNRRAKPGTTAAQGEAPSRNFSGTALIAAGQRELSQVWSFAPGDALGVWNIRITLDRRVLLDRPFLVYDATLRKQLNAGHDGGGLR
jgi:hypothetical protein